MTEFNGLQKYQKAKGKQVESDLILTCNGSAEIVVEKGVEGIGDNYACHKVEKDFGAGVVPFYWHHGVSSAHKLVFSSNLKAM